MNNIFQMMIIMSGLLIGQTSEQIKQARKVIQQSGMTESQARNAAKKQGYSEEQIDRVIKNEKALKTASNESFVRPEVEVTDFDKTNEILQKETSEDGTEPRTIEDLPIIDSDDLEIIDDLEISLESKKQNSERTITYFGYDIFERDRVFFKLHQLALLIQII